MGNGGGNAENRGGNACNLDGNARDGGGNAGNLVRQNVRKQIDYKRPSSTKQMNKEQNM